MPNLAPLSPSFKHFIGKIRTLFGAKTSLKLDQQLG